MHRMIPRIVPTLVCLTPAFAFGDDPRPVEPNVSKWAALVAPDAKSMDVGWLLRMSYDVSNDDLYQDANGNDVSGVRFADAHVWFSGTVGLFDLYVELDGAEASGFPPLGGGTLDDLEVRDAWAKANLCDELELYVGQYKCPLVASGNVTDGGLLFLDRTRIGQLFSMPGAYQPGVALSGEFGPVHAKLAVQNGADGTGEKLGVVARAEYRFGAGLGLHEGSKSSTGPFDAMFGAAYFEDSSDVGGGQEFGSAYAFDSYVSWRGWSAHAEIVDMDEELAGMALGNTTDGAQPHSATLGLRLCENTEAALRWQNLDDQNRTTLAGVGLNYYLEGHAAKVQLNVSKFEDRADDGTLFQIGLTLGADGY